MNRRRLALVTRRFWPLVGGAERVMSNLATEFRRQGHEVTIVTAQWERSWPTVLVHREIPVARLPNPPQRGWGTLRYMNALSRWLRQRHDKIDLVLVSMLKHDAHAALGALRRSRVPVVLRAEGGGASGDCHWQQTANFGRRIRRRCQTAAALIAPSETIAGELRAAGYPPDRTHFIPNGVAVPAPRNAASHAAARAALAETHEVLAVGPREPLVVYTGRLHEAKGLNELVECWRKILARWPNARLWLIGEGPHGAAIWQRIKELSLDHRIILPGSFDDVEDVLRAADVFVLPSYEEGMSLSLLEAMASGVSIVATDIPGNRRLVTHEEHGLLVPPRNAAELGQAIARLLEQPQMAARMGLAARQRVEQNFSLERMADAHLQVFSQAIARRLE